MANARWHLHRHRHRHYLLSGREATVWLGLALLIYSGLGISFTVSTLALGATLAQAGEMNTAFAVPSLVALAASLVGMWLGQLVRGMVRSEAFRLCFFLGLLVLGAHLALRGLL